MCIYMNIKIYIYMYICTYIRKNQGLLVEKCRFLEEAGCVRTCLHACKIPTQRFFLEGIYIWIIVSITYAFWLGLFVLRTIYRQNYETIFHVVILSIHHHHLEEMGLPVTLNPNMTDYSCKVYMYINIYIYVYVFICMHIQCIYVCK
jgi:low affinity Fe/Cu permease